MIKGSLARRYARALFEVGEERAISERLLGELERVDGLLRSSPELAAVMRNPVFDRQAKKRILDRLFSDAGAAAETRNFVKLLVDRGRTGYLAMIVRALRDLVHERRGIVLAQVVSAEPLDPERHGALVGTLARKTGRTVVLQQTLDPSIIGGLVVRIGGVVYDNSILSQLHSLEQKLVKEG